jgi:hypothetical protein
MIESIFGLVAVVGVIVAFFAGGRNARKANEITRIATEVEIRGAIRDADNSHDWRDRLHERE